MLQTSLLLLLMTFGIDEGADQSDLTIEPPQNQKELVKRIGRIGDAETVNGHIISVSLRDATDEDFALLNDLKMVRFLDCASCKTDGSGFSHITQMKRLESLWLHDNTFKSNDCLKYIGELPRLHTLWLENTPTNDIGLFRIRNLKSLRKLYLANTQVTDNGLKHLRGLTNIEFLDLDNTRVMLQGIEELKKQLPKAQIQSNVRIDEGRRRTATTEKP